MSKNVKNEKSVVIEEDDNSIPLTKPLKKDKKIEIQQEEQQKPIDENIKSTTIKIKKPRKPKTEKQMQQFYEVAYKKRMDNIEKKNYEKKLEASKFLLEHEQKIKNNTVKSEPKKLEPIPEISDESDESSEEEKVVIQKKKPKKETTKKSTKKKKIIKVIVSDSDSDESDDSHSSIEQPKRQMTSQRNKKSLIKVYENSYKHPTNYFCD
jgi:hypothetical protein